MAQTTGAKARSLFKLEVSNDGVTWTDISGAAAGVTPSGGEQQVGEQNTADGQFPIVTGSAKFNARQLEFNCVYTETAGEPWKFVSARYNSVTPTVYVRYSPKGGAIGDQRFLVSDNAGNAFAAPIMNCLPPEGDASSGNPLMFTFTVIAPRLYETTIT
jgi:hypothetical protein